MSDTKPMCACAHAHGEDEMCRECPCWGWEAPSPPMEKMGTKWLAILAVIPVGILYWFFPALFSRPIYWLAWIGIILVAIVLMNIKSVTWVIDDIRCEMRTMVQ